MEFLWDPLKSTVEDPSTQNPDTVLVVVLVLSHWSMFPDGSKTLGLNSDLNQQRLNDMAADYDLSFTIYESDFLCWIEIPKLTELQCKWGEVKLCKS